jgi:DNA polymerase-3 subunit beta
MKFKILKTDLVNIMDKIVGVVPKKNIKPILSGVRVFEQEGNVYFEATDMETSIRIKSPAFDIEESGEYVVEAETFRDIAKNSISDEMAIDLSENKAIAKVGKGRIKLPIMSASDFPSLDFTAETNSIQLTRKELKHAIDHTLFSASKDEMIRNLNGALIELSSNNFRMVTADSYRLAILDQPIEQKIGEEAQLFLSYKTIKTLEKLLLEEEITLHYNDKRIVFHVGDIEFAGLLLNVSFPNYKAVLPETFETQITVNKKDLVDSLKLINIIAKGKGDIIKLNIAENTVTVEAKSADRGDGNVPIPIEKQGKDMVVGFDPTFLIEGLSHIDDETVAMNFVSNANALQMQTNGFIHIIMPIKLRD